jgi:cyanophycinase
MIGGKTGKRTVKEGAVSQRLLFLLGGSPAFDAVGEDFVRAAGGNRARICLLMQDKRGWEKHSDTYLQPLQRQGVVRFDPVFPDESGKLDEETALAKLHDAAGILIGGGDTLTYHRLYTTGRIRDRILERYRMGTPVLGVSAGALLSLDTCVDTADNGEIQYETGLGLASGFIIGVHFTEWNQLPYVLEAMAETRTEIGWGLDESASAVFEDGQFVKALGQPVYQFVMRDFGSRAYTITQHDPA